MTWHEGKETILSFNQMTPVVVFVKVDRADVGGLVGRLSRSRVETLHSQARQMLESGTTKNESTAH